MNTKTIKIVSDEGENRTNISSLSQTDLVDELFGLLNNRELVISIMVFDSNRESIAFSDYNSKTAINIVIDKRLCGTNNHNVQAIEKIAQEALHNKMANSNAFKEKCGKFVLSTVAILGAAVVTIGAGKLLVEGLNKEFDDHSAAINSEYLTENGFDLRRLNGATWIDENHFVDNEGIEFIVDSSGNYVEIGEYQSNIRK